MRKFDGWARRIAPVVPGRARRLGVVGQAGAVRGADLDQARAGLGDDLRDPEAAADLDELAARDDELAPARERGGGQQRRRRAVVDHERGLGARELAQQRLDVVVARAARAVARGRARGSRSPRPRGRPPRGRPRPAAPAPGSVWTTTPVALSTAPQRRAQPPARAGKQVRRVPGAGQDLVAAVGQRRAGHGDGLALGDRPGLRGRHGRGQPVDGRELPQPRPHRLGQRRVGAGAGHARHLARPASAAGPGAGATVRTPGAARGRCSERPSKPWARRHPAGGRFDSFAAPCIAISRRAQRPSRRGRSVRRARRSCLLTSSALRSALDEGDALALILELGEVAPAAVLALLLAGRAWSWGSPPPRTGRRPRPPWPGSSARAPRPAPTSYWETLPRRTCWRRRRSPPSGLTATPSGCVAGGDRGRALGRSAPPGADVVLGDVLSPKFVRRRRAAVRAHRHPDAGRHPRRPWPGSSA